MTRTERDKKLEYLEAVLTDFEVFSNSANMTLLYCQLAHSLEENYKAHKTTKEDFEKAKAAFFTENKKFKSNLGKVEGIIAKLTMLDLGEFTTDVSSIRSTVISTIAVDTRKENVDFKVAQKEVKELGKRVMMVLTSKFDLLWKQDEQPKKEI